MTQVPLSGLALDEGGGRHNGDTAKRIQHQQFSIAGQDHICMSVHRQFGKLIVRRIAVPNSPTALLRQGSG